MRFCADENVSPALSDLIRRHLVSKGNVLDTVDDHQARGVEDDIWVRRFAKAGGQAIVGGDRRMITRPHELVAIVEEGLRLAILDQRWAREKRNVQVAHIFLWWPLIEEAVTKAKKGACLRVPWSWSPKLGDIKPAEVDVAGAYRKLRSQ